MATHETDRIEALEKRVERLERQADYVNDIIRTMIPPETSPVAGYPEQEPEKKAGSSLPS